MIEMALKSLFSPQNHTAAGVFAYLCDTLELHLFVQQGA